MFSIRAVNHTINRLHERVLWTLQNNGNSTFSDPLSKINDATTKKNIQNLMIKFYKYLHGLSTSIMREAFTKESSSNFEVVE